MKASALEFRLRVWIHAIIYTLGFWAPWNYFRPAGTTEVAAANAHVWGVAAAAMAPYVGSRTDPANILTAFNILLVIAILFAVAGAFLRTWGSAYLGNGVVYDGAMHTQGKLGVLEDGPYRHLRNPLYVGIFLHTVALALLMSRSGAVFTLVAIALVQVRLILGEEAFLSARLGQAYTDYCAKVPSVWPTLRAQVAGTGARPHWLQAFTGEISMWGTAITFAVLGWRYNATLLIQGVVVSFGLSVMLRAAMPQKKQAA